MALVVAGNVRVGWPGAPGCTMTGAVRSLCWAHTGNAEAIKVMTIISPRRHLATALNERRLGLSSQYKDFIEFEFQVLGISIYHKAEPWSHAVST